MTFEDLFRQPTASGGLSNPGEVLQSLVVALVLVLLIAETYRRTHSGPIYTQSFVHTLIIVGLVVSAVLGIVGTNIAAAFAIFGAFSIIRFRSAVPDTRDVGFIFFAMVVGLAAGAGDFTLAALTTFAVCGVILVLHGFDLFSPERTSHILVVRVTTDADVDDLFKPAFERFLDRLTVMRIESVQGGMLTEMRYAVRLQPGASATEFVDELRQLAGNNRVVLISTGPELVD